MNNEQNASRSFIGIELDRYYFDIAKKRIEEITKEKERKENER